MPLGANRIAKSSFPWVKVFPLRIFYPLLSTPRWQLSHCLPNHPARLPKYRFTYSPLKVDDRPSISNLFSSNWNLRELYLKIFPAFFSVILYSIYFQINFRKTIYSFWDIFSVISTHNHVFLHYILKLLIQLHSFLWQFNYFPFKCSSLSILYLSYDRHQICRPYSSIGISYELYIRSRKKPHGHQTFSLFLSFSPYPH